MPWGLEGEDLRCALEHERCHLRRGDPWFRLLAWLLRCVHWFNPLCWLAFLLMGRDMEESCDEAALARLGEARREYGEALLRMASESRRTAGPAPLAFGEERVGRRVKNVLRWKRAGAWVTLASSLLCLLFAAACATDPKAAGPETAELSLNADGTLGPFRWAMTPEEAAEAWPGLTFFEYENNDTILFTCLEEVTVLGYKADVCLVFPKLSMEGGRQHYDREGFPLLEEIQINIPEEAGLTEELTAILGERETRKVEDHLGPAHEYVNGLPRPCFHEEALPEEEWYWHSQGVLTDLVSADRLRILTPSWRNEPEQKILEIWCSAFLWDVHVHVGKYNHVSREEYPEGVTEICCYAYGYAEQRFLDHLTEEADA